MRKETKGIVNGIISGVSFGLIPLFSIPVLSGGMDNVSILIYRFLFGSIGMATILFYQKTSLKINWRECWSIALLALFYNATALSTLQCYHYMTSGVATALVYTDPIWCATISFLFLGERLSLRTSFSILIATMGVALLSGAINGSIHFSCIGTIWGLLSGLFYALYLIFMPRLHMKAMPSLKLTFYVFFFGMISLSIYSCVFNGGIHPISDTNVLTNLILLGLIPTALSNICVTMSLRLIDSTIVAILGAFEPLTAMFVGIVCLNEPIVASHLVGAMMILVAVTLLTIKKIK